MKVLKIFTITMLSSFLLGCDVKNDKYDLKEVNDRTYLINKVTGELSLVLDAKVVELPNIILTNKNNKHTINQSVQSLVQVKVDTKTIEDRLYYKIYIDSNIIKKGAKQMFPESYKENPDVFTKKLDFEWVKPALEKRDSDVIILNFKDEDGFVLKSKRVNINSGYTAMVDDLGNTSALSYSGDFKVNPLMMNKVKSIGFSYVFGFLNDAPADLLKDKTP